MFVAVFNLFHNKGIRGNLQLLSIGGLIRRKLNRRACHHRRGTFCLLEFLHDECTRKTNPYDPCGPVSSSFKVMFRLLRSNRNIGPFVCMFLVLRLCFLWWNTGLSRGGGGQPNYGVIPWLPEALRAFWPFGRQRRHAQLLLSTSSAICWFSIIVYCLRALLSKLAVLHCS